MRAAYTTENTLTPVSTPTPPGRRPQDQRERYIARGAHFAAKSILALADGGGIPAEEKQEAGEEAIARARQALEINTRLRGMESEYVASDMSSLGQILDYFNPIDDDNEAICLFEQAKAIYARTQGSLSVNVPLIEESLGASYFNRAKRARAANDLDRTLANLELALPRYREADRIYRAIGRTDMADNAALKKNEMEVILRLTTAEIAAATAATKG